MPKPIPRMSSVETLVTLANRGVAGRKWYDHARTEIIEAAAMLDVSPQRYADILSLFSPRVSVRRNIRLANHYLTTGSYHPTVMKNIRSSVEHYLKTGKIRGPKTGPFAAALMGDLNAIVLDVWMAKAFRIDQASFGRVSIHAECCRRVRVAGRRLGWAPAEVQAAIWTAAVRDGGRVPAGFSIVRRSLFGRDLELAA